MTLENPFGEAVMLSESSRVAAKLKAQADEYAFPYHYLPVAFGRLWLSKHWSFAPSYIAALKLVLERIEIVSKVSEVDFNHIDIGCGDGALLHYLSQSGKICPERLFGLDADENAIFWAKAFNPHIKFVAGDLSALDETFQSASLIEVIEHIPPRSLPDFLSKVRQRLAPDGLLIATVPSVEKRVYDKHFQHFTFESLRSILQADFCDIEILGFERRTKSIAYIERIFNNKHWRIDAPCFNHWLVRKLSELNSRPENCGRLLAVARARS
ncbi:class I SAM-dependent methyltransferase [Qipengyuania flava]|nr:class I SAM-dependent methyltransferase [Qipengyuania flava]